MSSVNQFAAFTIASGATKSSGFNVSLAPPRGLFIPAGFTGTTVTFEASTGNDVDGLYLPVRDATGALMQMTVVPNSYVGIYGDALLGLGWVRLVAATQVSAVSFQMALRA